MGFKKFCSVLLPYKKQALIHFICLDYADQPKEIQRKINALCIHVGKLHHQALFMLMTTENSVEAVARQMYISTAQLRRYRKAFYCEWYRFHKY